MVDVQPPLTIASAVILDERGASCDNTHIFKFLDTAFDRIDILTEHLAELLVGKVTLTAIPLELLSPVPKYLLSIAKNLFSMFVVPFIRLTVFRLTCIILFHDRLQLWRVFVEPDVEFDVEFVRRNLERHESSLSQQIVQEQLPANVGLRFFHCSFLLKLILGNVQSQRWLWFSTLLTI